MRIAYVSGMIRVIIRRELSVLWLRMIILSAAMCYIGFNRADFHTLLAPAMILGIFMGADFGNRDRISGFDLTVLSFPLSIRWQGMIRFLFRFAYICFTALIFGTVFNYNYIHSIPCVMTIFWMFMAFFASTISSMATRRGIVAVALSTGLLLGGFVLNFCAAYLSSDKEFLMGVVFNPGIVPLYYLLHLFFMFLVTVLFLAGVFTRSPETRNGVTLRQSIYAWLSGAILSVGILYLVPVYLELIPLENATGVQIVAATNDGDSVIVKTRKDSVPLGIWKIGSEGRQGFSKHRYIFPQVSKDGRYFLALDYSSHEASLEISRLGRDVSSVRQIEARLRFNQMKFRVNISPGDPQIAFVERCDDNLESILVVNIEHPERDWSWQPAALKAKDGLFPVGWSDSNTLICGVRKLDTVELWSLNGDGKSDRFWFSSTSKKNRYDVFYSSTFLRKNFRQSTVVLLSDSDKLSMQMLEILDDGRIQEHDLAGLEGSCAFLQDLQAQTKVLISVDGMGIIYDLESDKSVSINTGQIRNISFDLQHTAYLKPTKNKNRQLIIETTGSDESPLIIPDILDNVWITNKDLVILNVAGQLGRLNIETGEFVIYCDFDWPDKVRNNSQGD